MIDENTFFREVTLRLCGHLKLEEGLHDCFTYLARHLPARAMYLETYDGGIHAMRVVARADAAGGVLPYLGLALAWLGLRGIEMLFGDQVDNLVGMDWVMVLTAIALAIASALLAGLYPTWRACNITPAEQLKIQ